MILFDICRVLLILVWCVYATGTTGEASDYCFEANDGHRYRTEVQYSATSTSVMGIDVNWKTNDIYYVSYVIGKGCVYYAVKLGEKSVRVLGELNEDWCEVAVRQENSELYASCRSYSDRGGGLYKFDSNLNKFEHLHNKQFLVDLARFSNALYYLDYDRKLNTFVHGVSQPVTELWDRTLEDFVVESNGNIVFWSGGCIYEYKKKTNETVLLLEMTSIKHLALGPRGDVYGCNENAIYHINTTTTAIGKVIDAPLCTRLSVNKDNNFVYLRGYKEVVYLEKCTS